MVDDAAESPRQRRYHSDGPVLTPAELSNIVDKHARKTQDMPTENSQVVPSIQEDLPQQKPVPPIGEATPPPPSPPPRPCRPHRRCVVRRACCCLTLQQGAYCIAVMQVTFGLLTILMELMHLGGVLIFAAFTLDDDLTGTLPGSQQQWGPTEVAFASLSGILLFTDVLTLFFAGLLLHGARKYRAGFVRAWLIFTAFNFAWGVGSWAARLTLEFLYKPTSGAVLLIRCLIILALPTYFLIVVRSFYYQILDEITGIVPFSVESNPLLRGPPPPYSPQSSNNEQAPALERKQPLETNLDEVTTPTSRSAPLNSVEEESEDEGGFGSGWNGSLGSYHGGLGAGLSEVDSEENILRTGHTNESATVPRIVATISHDGIIRPVRDSWPLRGNSVSTMENARKEEMDEDSVEIRPHGRRIIAGPMVLPPLPPGHRESLQHVVMNYPIPTVTRSDPSLI